MCFSYLARIQACSHTGPLRISLKTTRSEHLPVWSSPVGWGIVYWLRCFVELRPVPFWYKSPDLPDWSSYRGWGKGGSPQPVGAHWDMAIIRTGLTRGGGRGYRGLLTWQPTWPMSHVPPPNSKNSDLPALEWQEVWTLFFKYSL